MKIKVSKSTVKKVGTNLMSNAEDLHNESKKINMIFDDLSSVWQGKDSEACINCMKEFYLPNLEKVCNKINSYGEYLKSVPEVYEEVDITFKSKKIIKE